VNLFQQYGSQAQAAFARGDMAEAERLFREALVHKPASPGATRGLGMALVNQQKYQDAEVVWQKAVEIEPHSADNHQLLGSVYLVNRKLAAAVTHLKRALEIQPNLPGVALKIGQIHYVNRDYGAAADYYGKAHALDPFYIDALKGLVQALMDTKRNAEAIAAGQTGVARLRARSDIPPQNYAAVYMIMADAYKNLKDEPAALNCYRTVIADNPKNDVAQHLLAAMEGRVTQDHAQGFARDIFDALASTFDRRLVEILKYRSPEVLAAGVRDLYPNLMGFKAMLDLGCGTGLMAVALAKMFQMEKVVGVDLSPNMIREAEKRGVYSELVCGDVVEAMAARTERFDLIAAADVFIYVGELSRVFALAKTLLVPGGVFVFTTEIGERDVELAAQGHYRHGKSYITRLADAHGFTVLRAEDAPIRKERGQDVMGHYVYLRG
jgi:predicted TPR repeat methyltransferase